MQFGVISFLFLAGGLPAFSHGDHFHPDHVLRISLAQVPSACESREDVVVNGTSPGPVIRLPSGRSSWIRVYNDMADRNLTMHWHGLSQRMAPFADGTPAVSQWPIPPGHYFDYEVAPEPDDAGTYFYHSHVDMQALSCAGPLIVDGCESPPFRFDDERILTFQDYFKKTDDEMVKGLLSTPFVWTGETRAILLNGKGVAIGHTAVEGPSGEAGGFFGSVQRAGNQIEPPSGCTLPVIDVEPGKTYRFRFIGSTGLTFLALGFEDHRDLTIVQVDGSEYNVPVTVDHLQLAGGQRFDVLFRTKTADELRDTGKTTYFFQFETRDRPEVYRGYGVLRYNLRSVIPAAPSAPVVDLPTDSTDWMEYTFQPLCLEQNRAPSTEEVTRRIILTTEQKLDNETGRLVWELAHMSWADSFRECPVLVNIYKHGDAAIPNYEEALENYGWDPATGLFPAKLGEVLEIVIQNTGSQFEDVPGIVESHPFHAHGQHFYDIGSGPGKYDPEENNAKLAALGYRPIKRDTTMLFRYEDRVEPGEPAGWRAWRMRMMQPGVWMIHCHILAHAIMGMQATFVVGDTNQIVTIPLTISENYFYYGGSVYGNATHTPAVYPYFNDTNKCCCSAGFEAAGGSDSVPRPDEAALF